MIYVMLYLIAIVSANLLIAQFGPSIAILNAFLFIAFDLTARDALHEKWNGKNLWRNMVLLIGTGSLLSALLNINATPIAIASFAAFAGAGIVDTLVYRLLGERSRLVRMNGSNLVSAAVDSLIFPILAFGFPPLWGIVVGQFVAKVFGGSIWSVFILYFSSKKFGDWMCDHNIHDLDLEKEEDFGSGNIAPCKRCGAKYISYNPYF